MKIKEAFRASWLVAIGSFLWTGCVYHEPGPVGYGDEHPSPVGYRADPAGPPEGEIIVSSAPPPPVRELVPVAPGPAFVWVPGHYVWHGHWIWQAGHWGRPPYPGAVWIAPRHIVRGGRHIFISGHWQ